MNHADRNITRSDVAKLANVSVGTVSNVINNKTFVKAELVSRVFKAVKELGYVQNYTAKSLASKNNNHIGVAIYEMTNPYHLEIVQGIEEYATEHDYIVSIFMLNNNFSRKLDAVCERNFSGLVNFMTNDYPNDFLDILKRQGTVLVNFASVDSIVSDIDYSKAIEQYCKLLRDLGHKKVGYIYTSDMARFCADNRGRAFLKLRKEMGFEENDDYIYVTNHYNDKSQDLGYLMAKDMFTRHKEVTAVFCVNDMAAVGALRAIKELGLEVPKDISIIGCDDIWLSTFCSPSISSITFNKVECGRRIAKEIIDRIKYKDSKTKKIITYAEPILRESVGKVRK